MARRIIATAEVQVAADVKQAEAGLEGLTESFRVIGHRAAAAAERVEAAFFGTARSASGGARQIKAALDDVINQMQAMGTRGKIMAQPFEESAAAARKLTDATERSVAMLRTFKEAVGVLGAMEQGLHDAGAAARVLAQREKEAAEAAQEIADKAFAVHRLERALRDVGDEIDLVMAGGRDGLENDIRDVIRRLDDMEGEFRQVARIGEEALADIFDQFDNDAEGAIRSLFRLESQLRDVAAAGDAALEGLESDARQSITALNQLDRAANRVEGSVGGMARRVSGDVRGLVTLLGAAGLGMAATSVTRWGLSMTVQLEKAEAMFLGLTGSVEGASDMLERMVMFARETPYNLANVTDAAAQLLAVGDGFGVTTANIEEYLTSFGNAITMTGGGDEQFTRLVRVFGQMSSSGKVLGQDMNQLAQNLPGYDVWQTLADGAGTSVKELRRLQDLGKLDELLTGNEAVQILIEGMENIPGAAGAMERRMDTLGGALEKFKETAQLSVSNGLQPFADTLQDTVSSPVILNSVEDMAEAFGSLASAGLEAVAPELDDLAGAVENVLAAMESWAPVAGHVADILGDFLNFIAPLIDKLGQFADAALGAGDGLGKLGIAAGLFLAGGPIGIGLGVLSAVSGAMDLFADSSENAAELARLLAAAQNDVNTAMAAGEEVIYSEAQQLAIDTASELQENYRELALRMQLAGVSVFELNEAMQQLASGEEIANAGVRDLFEGIERSRQSGVEGQQKAVDQMDAYIDAWRSGTTALQEETEDQARLLALAGVEDIAILEEREARQAAYNEAVADYWKEQGDLAAAAMDREAEIAAEVWELSEENAAAIRAGLEEQVAAYEEWEQGINDSTDNAMLSLDAVAEEAENSVSRIIEELNKNTEATANWQTNLVAASSELVNSFGVTADEAAWFMGELAKMGPESAPVAQALVDNFAEGGDDIKTLFDSMKANADVFSTDLVGALDAATGAAPSLAESISDGTATIDDLLAELPTLMAAAGVDMENAAGGIDLSDEMTTIGDDAVAGLVAALDAGYSRVQGAANRLAGAAASAVRAELQVRSPSRVMFEIGEFAVEGLMRGMQSLSDEAYATAANVASMMSGGIADHFRGAEDPQEAARDFAEDVAGAIIDELIAEQEAVADAAEALAEAAADRLSEAWDRVKDRFRTRDLAEAVAEGKAELAEARAELAAARNLAGAGGKKAQALAQKRVDAAEAAVRRLEQLDATADLAADATITAFDRSQEDQAAALVDAQKAEITAIQQRIDTATRNLDPIARQAAEADLAAAQERHEAERTALDRRQEDEAEALRRRLDNENDLREAAIKAKQDELDAFRDALDDVVDSIADAIADMPKLIADVAKSERDVQEAFLDQFEALLEDITTADIGRARSLGAAAGLTAAEYNELISAAIAANKADDKAAAAQLGVSQLLNVLSSGLYTIGANGSLGIAAGITGEARAIAKAMLDSVQAAVDAALAALQIRSPSQVTADLLGRPMAQGIAAGLTATIPEVGVAMAGLLDNVVRGTRLPPTSGLVDGLTSNTANTTWQRGPLITMPGAVIQDATDADLVAQRLVVALSATGVEVPT